MSSEDTNMVSEVIVDVKIDPCDSDDMYNCDTDDECTSDKCQMTIIKSENDVCSSHEIQEVTCFQEDQEELPGRPKYVSAMPNSALPHIVIKRPRRTALSREEKEMILNVYKAELQNSPLTPINDIVDKAAYYTGVSGRTIYRVIKEYKRNRELSAPKKNKPRAKLLESIGSYDRNAIRKLVNNFSLRNELPTLDMVLKAVNDDPQLPNFKRTTLHKLLKELNFEYVKRGRRSMLIDRDDIMPSFESSS